MRSWVAAALFLASFLAPRCALSETTCSGIVRMRNRGLALSISEFGAVGDGRTDNTWPFRRAMYRIKYLKVKGGTLLYVPPGVWLTRAFNLTSHLTLYLAKGATIKAIQDTQNWPLVSPLPSYGRGRERPGGRYGSFIHGDGLHDVVITGENGTIDGSGDVWWNMWRQRTLKYTRPHLLELMHSTNIIISNVILRDSPFWTVHPVYCSNVVVRYVTILAPRDSPNTDGIDPDSSSNVCIEDSHISVGDDLVAVKSGWDEYGIAYGRPSNGITVRRITGSTPFSGIAIGSEVSGGVENILVEKVNIYNSGFGLHIKTNTGRGGYIKNVTVSEMKLNTVRYGLAILGDAGDHPDENFNPNAVPTVEGITIKNVWGVKIQQPGSIHGIKGSPFKRICLSNAKFFSTNGKEVPWKCTYVMGSAVEVHPWPCPELISPNSIGFCSVGL